MIFAAIAFVATISTALAQNQEVKLIDRLLKPDLSLVNSTQNQKFDASRVFATPSVPLSKNYYTPEQVRPKSFPLVRRPLARKFATSQFQVGENAARAPLTSRTLEVSTIPVSTSSSDGRIAREDGRNFPVVPFAGNGPFLAQGKSQKALSAQDTPLTIEQVRELLNKNK